MISPGLRIGRYEVGRRLGKGGFGVVHVARDVDLDREIAIKVLKPEYLTKPQIVQRFIKEARAAAKIGHAGIVTVFECGQIQGTGTRADGNAYIAMELLVGQSLSDRLLDGGRMSMPRAIAITRQLAAALGAAHHAGIIHRDLKPDNVFLVPDAAVMGGERVKVLDFGVAKLMDPADDGVNTHSQMMLGTPKYMSPEQARSASTVDHRADIYALGCMLFEMLTGRVPFGGDAGELLLAHQKTAPPSARLVVSTVPPSIDALIRRMLAKAPDDRPQTMNEVGDALTELTDEPDTMVRAPFEVTPDEAKRPSAEITAVAPPARTPPPGTDRRVLFVAAAGAGLMLSALVMFFVLRGRSSPARAPAPAPAVAEVDAALPQDAPEIVYVPDAASPTSDLDRLRLQCLEARDQKRWSDLIACAEELMSQDRAQAQRLYDTGHEEMRAEASNRALTSAVAERDVPRARAELDKISRDSVYYAGANKAVMELEVGAKKAEPAKEPPNPCDRFDELVGRGQDAYAGGRAVEALASYEAAYRCKPGDPTLLRYCLAAACKAKNLTKARTYWKKMTASARFSMESLCAGNGFYVKDLEN